VDAFLAGQLPFPGIVDIVAQVVSEHDGRAGDAAQLADVLAADRWARDRARELTSKRVRRAAGASGRRGDSAG
jgi:1-deoxy-D-xylulose-5-phosphate reductoisomerase